MPRPRKSASPLRYFNSSSEVIRLPLSLGKFEDLLAEGGIANGQSAFFSLRP